jgi:hypothetical protein
MAVEGAPDGAGETAGAPSRATPAGDFVAGVVLFLIALYTLVESVRMPFYGDAGVWGSPGLTPGLISAVLLLLSGLLILRSRRFRLSALRMRVGVEHWRGLAVLGVIIAYAAAVPTLGYVPATFLMLLIFQIAFAPKHSLGYFLVWGVGLSAALTAALWWLFGEFFFIPLPRGPLGV